MAMLVSIKPLRAISLCCILCLAFVLNAQNPIHKVYTNRDGLPSNDIRSVSQDNLGFIWLLNGDGITRFDGNEFDYTFLGNKVYMKTYKDHLGRVWIYGSSLYSHIDQLKYCQSGRIHEYQHNAVLDSLAVIIRSIVVDEEENVWLGLSNESGDSRPSFLKISPEGQTEEHYFDVPAGDRTLILKKVGNVYVQAVHRARGPSVDNSNLWIVNETDTTFLFGPDTHECRPYYLQDRLFFIARHLGVLELIDGELVEKTSNEELGFPFGYLDKKGQFLVPTMGNGLMRYDSLDFDLNPDILLKEAHFSAVFQSADGGYWLGTRDKGLYYIPSFDIQIFDSELNLPNDMVTDLQVTDTTLWITYRSWLSRIHLNREKLYPENYELGGQLFGSYLYKDSLMFLGGLYDIKVPKEFPYEILRWPGASGMRPFSKGKLSYTGGHSLHSWYGDLNGKRIHFLVGDFVKSHLQLNYNHFLYSDHGGLKRYKYLKISQLGLYDTLLAKPVHEIEPIEKNWLLLASEAYGVIAMKDTANLFAFGVAHGLSGNQCKDLRVDTDSTFWVVTENGLDHVQYSVRMDTVLLKVLWQFGKEYQVPFVDAIHLRINKDDVWLVFMNEIIRVPKKLVNEIERPLRPVVQNVYHSGDKVKIKDSMCFPYTFGTTDFEIVSPCFTAPQQLEFKYNLASVDTLWKITSKKVLSFEGIPPGVHTLKIMATNNRRGESELEEFRFEIKPLFWQTVWFKAAGILLIFTAGLYYAFRKKKERDRRKRLLGEIKTYKNTAMRLQMNPHFIYNSLGSIQSFVLKQESRVSSKYIAKLSRLMRLIFDHNNRELISLKEELEVLDLYVNLEFLRHDQNLKYELYTAPELSPENIMVPPMVLQPFVENAILHGLVPQKGLGLISVSISSVANGLTFSIADNGTGMRFSEKKGAGARRSGGGITADRIALFNQQHHFKGDFKLDEKHSLGTRVSFSLPLITLE